MMELAYWLMEVVLLLTALRGRREAVMVLAFSLPFSRRLPSLPIPLLNFQTLVVIFAFLSFVAHPKRPDARPTRVRHAIPLALLAFFLFAAFLNTTITFTPEWYVRFWSTYRNAVLFKSYMTCLGLYVMGSLMVRHREVMIDAFRAALAGIIAESAWALMEYVVLRPSRVTGHLEEPNSAGAYFAGGFVLLLGIFSTLPRKHPHRWHAAGGSVLCAVAMLGTLSRGAMISAMLGFFLLTAFVNRKLLATGAIILALSPMWVPESVKARMNKTITKQEDLQYRFREGESEDSSSVIASINAKLEESSPDARLDASSQARLLVWTIAFEMVADYPFGQGFGVFPWRVYRYTESMWFKATHNIYLKIATEDGLQTLGIFLFLLGSFCFSMWGLWRKPPDEETEALAVGMLFYLFTFLFNAFFLDLFFQIETNGQFWFLTGALFQARILARPAEAPAKEPSPDAGPARARALWELVR